MGAFLKVELPIIIEKGARVAQAIINETYTVDKEYLYDGQWQGDKQRKS
jgi:deoxycytidine triphosphate deaminase